jgi:uncharacterized protein YjiS (DUF1127 family)
MKLSRLDLQRGVRALICAAAQPCLRDSNSYVIAPLYDPEEAHTMDTGRQSSSVKRAHSTHPHTDVTIATVLATVRVGRQRSRSRSELAAMDDATLRELGVTRAQAAFEAAKPFWRAEGARGATKR